MDQEQPLPKKEEASATWRRDWLWALTWLGLIPLVYFPFIPVVYGFGLRHPFSWIGKFTNDSFEDPYSATLHAITYFPGFWLYENFPFYRVYAEWVVFGIWLP